MTIRPSIDVAARVSAELSELLAGLASDPDRETPVTLGEARRFLRKRESLLVELDALIEEFGEESPAADFVASQASEGLSRVIETAVEDPTLPKGISLTVLREAMAGGLIARLVGNGALDEDDDTALLGEVDELIRRHGANAPAENFIRYE